MIHTHTRIISRMGRRRNIVLTTAILTLTSAEAFSTYPDSRVAFGISTRLMSTKAVKGDIVTVDFSVKSDSNLLFDTGNDISFALHGGNYIADLHSTVETLSLGEKVSDVKLDAGFGDRRDDLIAKVPRSGQDGLDYDSIKVGTELMLANGLPCVVTEVTDEEFTIDANPPLAGVRLNADVTLKAVEKGPSEEKYLYKAEGVKDDGNLYEVATFALGCFWGGELAFMREAGVVATKVGYTQGETENPSYKEVCSGTTGHTEGIQIVYHPEKVSYRSLVTLAMERLGESMFKLNQVGNDRGTQYRHGVYYHNDDQKEVAESIIKSFGDKCVTEYLPADKFWDAEDHHQQYLLKGGQSAKKSAEETIRCYG